MILLLLLAAVFGCLAFDAYSMGTPARHAPYEIEARARGENLDGVSLAEQRNARIGSAVRDSGNQVTSCGYGLFFLARVSCRRWWPSSREPTCAGRPPLAARLER